MSKWFNKNSQYFRHSFDFDPHLYIYNKYEITWVYLKDGTVKICSKNS